MSNFCFIFCPFLKTLMERKKKWQVERQRWDKEVEDLRKSSQQELDNLWAQLRKARTSTDNSASEQVAYREGKLAKYYILEDDP